MYCGERFNSISHLVGAVLALIGFGVLLAIAIDTQSPRIIVGFTVFGATMVMLYTMSTLYHSFHPPKLKRFFQKLDHISIYLLIAGTYTPYMLVTLKTQGGHRMLAFIWILAISGLLLDIFKRKRVEWLQCSIYMAMGWACIFELNTLIDSMPTTGVAWLVAGGLTYTVGFIFYALDCMNKLKHAHGIWHLFVLAGSAAHFISVAGYVR